MFGIVYLTATSITTTLVKFNSEGHFVEIKWLNPLGEPAFGAHKSGKIALRVNRLVKDVCFGIRS